MVNISNVFVRAAGADSVVILVETAVEMVLVRIVETFWFFCGPMLNEFCKKTQPYLLMISIL